MSRARQPADELWEWNPYRPRNLQQAPEKLAKAVLTARGEPATREHRIAELTRRLSPGDTWHPLLASLDAYATAFRYPGTSGRLRAGLAPDAARDLHARLVALAARARSEVGIGR